MSDSGYVSGQLDVLTNTNYRCVVHTGRHLQTAFMCLEGDEDIPGEVHRGDQHITVFQGAMEIGMNGHWYEIDVGGSVVIPAGVYHEVRKISDETLRLLTIYSDREHSPLEVEGRQ